MELSSGAARLQLSPIEVGGFLICYFLLLLFISFVFLYRYVYLLFIFYFLRWLLLLLLLFWLFFISISIFILFYSYYSSYYTYWWRISRDFGLSRIWFLSSVIDTLQKLSNNRWVMSAPLNLVPVQLWKVKISNQKWEL